MQSREEKQIDSEIIYRGNIINLRRDRVSLPRGGTSQREVVEHPGAVAVVPETGDGRIIMVKQYRYAVKKPLLEIPAGKLDKGEEPESCALREMIEETGYRVGKLQYLTAFHTSPGFCNEIIYLYRGSQLVQEGVPEDSEENIRLCFLKKEEIWPKIISGSICDAKTLIGLLWVLEGK